MGLPSPPGNSLPFPKTKGTLFLLLLLRERKVHPMYLSPVTLPPPSVRRLGFLPRTLLLLGLLLVGHCAPAQASVTAGHTYYVALTGSDANPGTASQPFLTIQRGVNAAVNGDTVIVEDGTYSGAGNRDIDFGGRNITVTSQNGAASTILDCQGSANAYHRGFNFHSGETSAVVNGLSIKNGYINDHLDGGGVYTSGSNPTISNCTFTNNTAGHGGGIYNYTTSGNTMAVTNCTFTGNTATGEDGGGIYNVLLKGSSATVTNCTFMQNTAFFRGGGVWNYTAAGCTVMMAHCQFTGNSVSVNRGGNNSGGGIFNFTAGGTSTLTDCTLTSNTALGGGGIENTTGGGTSTITDCTLTGNTASFGGGIENGARGGGDVLISHCALTGNIAYSGRSNLAGGDGGGIANGADGADGGTVTITDCTLTGNAAKGDGVPSDFQGYGGGISNGSSGSTPITVANCLFNNNTAGYSGGGVYNSGPATLVNCTLTSNAARIGGGIASSNQSSGTITVTGCALTGNSAVSGGGLSNANYGSGTVAATNCTLTHNSATRTGGGIDNFTLNYNGGIGTTSVTGCMLTSNSAGAGGGIANTIDGSGTIYVTNNILFGETGGEVYDDPSITVPTVVTHCDIQGGYAGVGNLNADPLFVNAAAGDYHLMPASPCAGAGTSSAPAYLPYTQDNQPRPNPPSIGAFEVSTARLVLTNIAISRSGGTVTVTAKIQNYGNADASAVQITQARLGTVAANAPLPGPYAIPAGGVQAISLTFTTNVTGRKPFSIQGVSNGPSFSAGQFLTVP